jgi:isoleucyl-tRNA synthetase
VHNFCANELGSAYLDITKDRQYTMQADSLGRRSSQTAMYHILEALTRWIAPILSFTAEELWGFIPGQRNDSVLLNEWYADLAPLDVDSVITQSDWENIFEVRETIAKQLEEARNRGEIKGGLTAEVSIAAPSTLPVSQSLAKLGAEQKFLFIVSKVSLSAADNAENSAYSVSIARSQHTRCERCWHQTEDVGSHAEHPDLCGRCVSNAFGDGEQRQFA